mgnify:FL=1
MTLLIQNSGIYQGVVSHRRFTPKTHSFNYSMSMFCLDVDELADCFSASKLFGERWFHPFRFKQNDYIKGESGQLKERILKKVAVLSKKSQLSSKVEKIRMLVQPRCFSFYFSPINFYFCYGPDEGEESCLCMLAEVSNTPWNERHYYLLESFQNNQGQKNNKDFHVSPFMEMDMMYHWNIQPPAERFAVQIQNKSKTSDNTPTFIASLKMTHSPLNKSTLARLLRKQPVMTVKIVGAIYWQALKIFLKVQELE